MYNCESGVGGGGGTFVILDNSTANSTSSIPLIVAGGGAGHPDNFCPLPASLTEVPLGVLGAINGIG